MNSLTLMLHSNTLTTAQPDTSFKMYTTKYDVTLHCVECEIIRDLYRLEPNYIHKNYFKIKKPTEKCIQLDENVLYLKN